MDGLRALAALWVALYHAYEFFYRAPGKPHGGLWFDLMSAGHLGVPVFLALSGFCLAYPYARKKNYRVYGPGFALRRALRIAPPYYVVMAALVLLVQVPAFRERVVQQPTDAKDIVLHVLMAHNLFGEHIWRISGPFWSIALESQLYVVFPLLLAMLPRPALLAGVTVALGAVWWFVAPQHANFATDASTFAFWNSLPSLLCVFAGGMIAAKLSAEAKGWGWGWACLPLWALAVWLDVSGQPPPWSVVVAGLGACSALLVTTGHPFHRWFSWPPLVSVGLVSYTLYLTHNPVISLAGKLAAPRFDGWLLHGAAAGGVLIAVFAASMLFPIIEKPFHELARRLAPRV